MASLLNKYLSKTEFSSYEDFYEQFQLNIPEQFNFAYDVVDHYAQENPDKLALVWCNDDNQEKILTFEKLKYYSDKAANLFLKYGIRKGDCVMLTLKSRYEFWISIVALHKIGAIAVPATHMLKAKDIEYRIESANLKMIVCIEEDGVPEQIEEALAQRQDISLIKAYVGSGQREGWISFRNELEEISADFTMPADCKTSNDDISLIYFTSGTTGMPKMIQHDYKYPFGHILTAKYWQNVIEDGLHYTVADSGWAKSVWGLIYGQWLAGSAVFVHDFDRFDVANMMEKISKYKVTTFCAPPTIYRFMIKQDLSKYDFSSLKYVVTAGEPLNPEVYNKILEFTGLKLIEGYGQTETVIAVANYPWLEPKPGSMGKPSPGYDIALMDNEARICDVGEEGEIVVRTADKRPIGIFQGYYGEPERTKTVWYDGYYHTGDTAWKDEDGYMWFVGRTDDLIKSSGYRIGPFEVESALISHPSILECAITSIPDPDRGHIVKATVVLTNDYTPSDDLKKELQDHVKRVTAPYKYPREIEFAKELPKTISGKIRRVEIRDKDQKKY